MFCNFVGSELKTENSIEMKNIRKQILVLLALLFSFAMGAQNVTWSDSVEKVSDNEYDIVLEAEIPNGYHMYDLGPYELINATTFNFICSEGAELVGGIEALSKATKYFDDIFEIEIGYYEMTAKFRQRVKTTGDAADVKVEIAWQICDDSNCLPLDDATIEVKLGDGGTVAAVSGSDNVDSGTIKPAGKESKGGLWGYILEAILWGLAALLTPCVFPMVPMTVSFFLKGEGGAARSRLRAALYGLFIVLLYTLPIAAIIIVTRLVGGDAVTADIFNWLATHWLPNTIFFIVFMVFAASFFGAFEIELSTNLVNKSDSKSDTKGLSGIFFLALTLVLVSFSCTGPIVGSVLIKSTSGEFWTPIITMLAFSMAFALPFTILALFPSLLKKLPKSGGWLNSVKVVIGFIEVALGFKFLSVADQTYHWGLLDREIYLAIWIVVFTLLGFYLLGKIRFAHDSEVKHIGVGRLSLAIIVFTFVVYMIPGMWGAPLKGLSGYLPPLTSQDFVLTSGGSGAAVSVRPVEAAQNNSDGEAPKYSDFLHLPHNLQGFFTLEEASAYAEKVGKPIFIDITGHGCVNCREMEARVWADPQVLEILRNDYVICALYTDDKTVLPESEWVTSKSGKVLKTLGKINSNFALETYGVAAQPYYILQTADGRQLSEPRSYDLSVEGFVKFLNDGLEDYAK